MSVLVSHFNKKVNQFSPSCDTYERVVKFDDEGAELVTFEPVDLRAVTKSLGTADQWSLRSLLKAGIDPAFPIKTGYNSRLDGIADLQSLDSQLIADTDVKTADEVSE